MNEFVDMLLEHWYLVLLIIVILFFYFRYSKNSKKNSYEYREDFDESDYIKTETK